MTYPSNPRRRRAVLLTSAAALATGVAMAVLPTSPASAAGTADKVCAVGTPGQEVRVALVGDSSTACSQALHYMGPGPVALGGSCAGVIHRFLPNRDTNPACADIHTQWQPIPARGPYHRTYTKFRAGGSDSTCFIGSNGSNAAYAGCSSGH